MGPKNNFVSRANANSALRLRGGRRGEKREAIRKTRVKRRHVLSMLEG